MQDKKLILIGLCISLILISGCDTRIPDGFVFESNTFRSCIMTCDSGYYWNGNGSCIYNGVHNFENDTCYFEVTQIDKGNITAYYD